MSTILTAAGESLIARLQAEGKPLIIDTMILANVPGQDHTQAIAPGVAVPAEAQIALRYAIPPQYRAYVNPNQVVYSAMLGSDMGDFTFNWQGLWCSEHNTLVAVATFPALEKRRYDEANGKTGNNLTRNFLLTFTGARELTGLTISADVWQLDFTVRLNGIDERQRLANFDIYGQAFFDAQGWLLQKTPEAYAFAPGLGYVGGIRAALAESLPLAAPESANLPQNVWLDVCLKHTGSDRVAEASPMLAPPAAPLTDSAADETGLMHYRALVARIEADGSVTDLRPRKTSGALPIPDVATPEVAGTMRPDGSTCTASTSGILSSLSATPWRDTTDYTTPLLALGPDGKVYKQLSASGPTVDGVGPKIPGAAGSDAYWELLQKDPLKTDINLYVATTGSDSNDGLSAAQPLRSINKAVSVVCNNYDLKTYNAIINIADGIYDEYVVLPAFSGTTGALCLVGSGPNTIIAPTGTSPLRRTAISTIGPNYYRVENLKCRTPSATRIGLGGVYIEGAGGKLTVSNCVLESIAASSTVEALIAAIGAGSSLTADSNTLNATAKSVFSLWMSCHSASLSITGSSTVSGAVTNATVMSWNVAELMLRGTISGAITGQRYAITGNAIVDSNGGGANVFPGTVAGAVATGGQYV